MRLRQLSELHICLDSPSCTGITGPGRMQIGFIWYASWVEGNASPPTNIAIPGRLLSSRK